ncbi:MAG: GreA/GreB family elongation factor [Clostridiales bacterium]|nr:GreA/GreB family elongation factor [Clostridiales bacterium]
MSAISTGLEQYVLKNGEPVEVVGRYNDMIVFLYHGHRFVRPISVIGTEIFPKSDFENTAKSKPSETSRAAGAASSKETKQPQKHSRTSKRIISAGDTVCFKFVETGRKAVYTISETKEGTTSPDGLPDECTVYKDSPIAVALIGKKPNEIVTFTYNGNVIVIQIMSFFKKTTGIYQLMKEQRESQKAIEKQKKQEEKIARKRGIKVGNTVCVEFLDTNEKKAFKIVEAWAMVSPDATTKPYRPTSYENRIETEANPDENSISEASPLAKVLIGKGRGDVVRYRVGENTTEVRIIAFFDSDAWLKNQKNHQNDE